MTTRNLEKEIADLTRAPVPIPSSPSRPGKISKSTDLIPQWLYLHHTDYSYAIANNVPSIVLKPLAPTETRVLLPAHADSVETTNDSSLHPRRTVRKYLAALYHLLDKQDPFSKEIAKS